MVYNLFPSVLNSRGHSFFMGCLNGECHSPPSDLSVVHGTAFLYAVFIPPRVTVVTVEFCGWRSWILPAPGILKMSILRCFSVVTAAKRVTVTLKWVTVELIWVTVTLSKPLHSLSAFCERFVPSELLWGSLSGIHTGRHTGKCGAFVG